MSLTELERRTWRLCRPLINSLPDLLVAITIAAVLAAVHEVGGAVILDRPPDWRAAEIFVTAGWVCVVAIVLSVIWGLARPGEPDE